MSCFLSLKLLATVGSKSRAVTKFRAAAATTGAASNLVRHFSLGQALGVNLVKPKSVNYRIHKPPEWDPNDPKHNTPGIRPSIAVILSGCGQLDGTDVHEAIYTMLYLSRFGIYPTCFAPTGQQKFVVDHVSNTMDVNAYRHMRDESARMTWEKINDLENLRVEDHEGLIIPGGIGIFRNLTDYFTREEDNALAFEMDETLNQILLDFYWHRKPMGFLGNASILAAKVFHGVRIITFGDEANLRERGMYYLIDHANRLHAKLEDPPAGDGTSSSDFTVVPYRDAVFHDRNYKIFSARAGLPESFTYYDLSLNIDNLVIKMLHSLGYPKKKPTCKTLAQTCKGKKK